MTYSVEVQPDNNKVFISTSDGWSLAISLDELPIDAVEAGAIIDAQVREMKTAEDAARAAEAAKAAELASKATSLQAGLENTQFEIV